MAGINLMSSLSRVEKTWCVKHAAAGRGGQRGATAEPAAMGAAGSKAEPPVKFDDNGKQLGRWLAEGRAARPCGAAAVDDLTRLFPCAGIRAKRSAARARRPRRSATSASRKMDRKTVPTSSRRTRPVYARRASQSPDSRSCAAHCRFQSSSSSAHPRSSLALCGSLARFECMASFYAGSKQKHRVTTFGPPKKVTADLCAQPGAWLPAPPAAPPPLPATHHAQPATIHGVRAPARPEAPQPL